MAQIERCKKVFFFRQRDRDRDRDRDRNRDKRERERERERKNLPFKGYLVDVATVSGIIHPTCHHVVSYN